MTRVTGRGPSPRVRGIRWPAVRRAAGGGSIPARAGNPHPSPFRFAFSKVHPRACGESPPADGNAPLSGGPSPRVRGIPGPGPSPQPPPGSIPARAGNPPCISGALHAIRVHPRACGESAARDLAARSVAGPSPRVRGILRVAEPPDRAARSIPARAGNPTGARTAASNLRVHPRACGESLSAGACTSLGAGPSPRVRGIPGPPAVRRAHPEPRSTPCRW